MKEFSQDIEKRMEKAFKSTAGKKYGLKEADLKKYSQNSTFGVQKKTIDEIEKSAHNYLYKIGHTNQTFLRKQTQLWILAPILI